MAVGVWRRTLQEMRAAIWPSRVSAFRSGTATLALAVALLVAHPGPFQANAAGGCPEPNDSADKACELKVDNAVEDIIADADDVDRLRIEVKDGQSVQVSAKGERGGLKLKLETADGDVLASVGAGPGERLVLAERLPAGKYVVAVGGEGGDPGTSYPYAVSWSVVGSGAALPALSSRGSLRDLTLAANEVGEQAVQTGGRLLATDVGRVYEAIYERENSEKVRKAGPIYLLNRVHVAESASKAQSVFDAWAVSDHLPEANDARSYGSLGDQPMPPFGDTSYAIGACNKCDDENPLRSYRIVARFDNVVHVLYSYGRDSSSNFDVVMFLAYKLQKHL